VNAILYLARSECAWRLLPKDFPPWETVYWYWKRWKNDGTGDRVHDRLRNAVRDADGRDAMPAPGSWTPSRCAVADTVGADHRGYDTGKRANARPGRMRMSSLSLVWADSGYAGRLVDWVWQKLRIALDIVRKPD